MGNLRSKAQQSLSHLTPTSSEKPSSVRDSSEASDTESLCSDAMGDMNSNAQHQHSLTHLVPTSFEKPPSVRDSSEASDIESLSSDATLEVSLCFDDEVELQRNFQKIMHQHTDDVIKKWGNSEQWVLELRDGKRVAVPIQFSSSPGHDIVGVDDSNHLAIVPGRATESEELNSETEKGIDVFVEDWSSDFCSEEAFQFSDSSPPLTVDPLAFALPLDATDFSVKPTSLVVDTVLGKGSYSAWFKDKFSGFDDFLGTSLKGLEEPATAFLLAVENEIQQRAFKDKIDKSEKSSGWKGIRELRGLFSSVNYGSASARRSSYGKDKALFASQ